jgi:hypothetical protein
MWYGIINEPNSMLITRKSDVSGKKTTRDLPITQDQITAWENGMLIQMAFPNLSAEDREWLKSGITEEEWKELL